MAIYWIGNGLLQALCFIGPHSEVIDCMGIRARVLGRIRVDEYLVGLVDLWASKLV